MISTERLQLFIDEMNYREMTGFLGRPETTFQVEKIHPFDFFALVQGHEEVISRLTPGGQLSLFDGKVYFQTTSMPAKSEQGKAMAAMAAPQ